MSLGYKYVETYNTGTLVTASGGIVIGPVDIRGFDKYTVYFQNLDTSAAFLDMVAQVAFDPSASAAGVPNNWIGLSTAVLEVPSALGKTAVAISSRVDNVHGYLRLVGHVCQTMPAQHFRVTVSGFQRY